MHLHGKAGGDDGIHGGSQDGNSHVEGADLKIRGGLVRVDGDIPRDNGHILETVGASDRLELSDGDGIPPAGEMGCKKYTTGPRGGSRLGATTLGRVFEGTSGVHGGRDGYPTTSSRGSGGTGGSVTSRLSTSPQLTSMRKSVGNPAS